MKRVLSLLICFIVLFSSITYAAPYETAENAEQILIDYFYNNKDSLYPNTDTEIEEAFLADIDNDGIPELIFSRYMYWYGLTVYKVKDGRVVEVPDKIMFGRGTGIHEECSFLMDAEGHMYIYREGEQIFFSSEDGRCTTQVIYDWSEQGLKPIKYLGMTIDYGNLGSETGYTTDLNAESNADVPKIKISSREADAKFEEFKNQLKPYVVWSEDDTDKNSGLTRIWSIQKEKYKNNTVIGADKYIVLQIGNPLMNVNGLAKAIDTGIGTTPIVKNGRTLVPVRAVVEDMGGTVEWDGANNTAILSYAGNQIRLIINSNVAYLNNLSKQLDVAPIVMNGRTLLPIRFIAESFGFKVTWKELTQQIVITGNSDEPDNNSKLNMDLLSCIGKNKQEISNQYGGIVSSEFWMGGKHYIHSNLKSQIFYENNDDIYDYEKHDDVEDTAKCLLIWANLSELFNTPNKATYTIEELQSILGKYEFTDDLDNDFYPSCFYKFYYGDYVISIESDHKNPSVDYVYISKE